MAIEQYTKLHSTAEAMNVTATSTIEEIKPVEIEVTYSKERVEHLVREAFPEAPGYAVRVAKCESGLNYEATHKNTDGTVDRGVFQLNSTHNKEMKRLGLDPMDARDNIKFARMLYDKEGWRPWSCVTRKMI